MKIFLIRLLMLIAAISLAACGGGGGGGTGGGTTNSGTTGNTGTGGVVTAFNATTNTTAQILTVNVPMTSFSPLTPTGGSMPYSYSYTGSLPAGLNLNTSTGVVSGIPASSYSTANVVFFVADARKVGASMTSTVSFTVNNASGTAAISAVADTTAQILTVGTAMPSFSPLLASGGTPPYTYSYTASLPAGLNFDSNTGMVSGTPTSPYSTANLLFSVKDANNVIASTISTVSFTVNAVATPAISAAADTTAQNLTVNTPMPAFVPLVPHNGNPPYTYSYEGTLPAGLSFDANSGVVSGTPNSTYAPANVSFSVQDADNVVASTPSTVIFTVYSAPLNLTNDQAASIEVGQLPDTNKKLDYFTNNTPSSGAAHLNGAWTGVFVDANKLYIADYNNNRVMVYNNIPAINGDSADFTLGQPDLASSAAGTSASTLNGPLSPMIADGKLFLTDHHNNRINIYNTVPTTFTGNVDVVLGQVDKQSSLSSSVACNATSLANPATVWVAANKVIVADADNNRVLIWNHIPTMDGTPADLVLGQTNMTSCAYNASATAIASKNTLSSPSAAWTDGTRVVVVDTNNNRVLIWNRFPSSNGQAADLVLGQQDFSSVAVNQGGAASASTMNYPWGGVFVHNGQLFVADVSNNRVLVWNSFPISNNQPADQVLGQPDFTTTAAGTSQTTLTAPSGVYVSGMQLFISDAVNNRVMIYNGN